MSEGAQLQDLRVAINKRESRKTAVIPFVHKNFAETRHAGVHALQSLVGRCGKNELLAHNRVDTGCTPEQEQGSRRNRLWH